jgi:hypothetical protein
LPLKPAALADLARRRLMNLRTCVAETTAIPYSITEDARRTAVRPLMFVDF